MTCFIILSKLCEINNGPAWSLRQSIQVFEYEVLLKESFKDQISDIDIFRGFPDSLVSFIGCSVKYQGNDFCQRIKSLLQFKESSSTSRGLVKFFEHLSSQIPRNYQLLLSFTILMFKYEELHEEEGQ